MHELALTESPSLRAEYVKHVEVLDKVKALTFFPDGKHVDAPGVATYYEVTPDTIKKVIQRNRKELESNGLRVLRGEEYREFARTNTVFTEGGDTLSLAPSQNSVTIFTRRTILNIGQMLTGSKVAEEIRRRLLDVEEAVRAALLGGEARALPQPEPFEPNTYPLVDALVLIRQKFGIHIGLHDLVRTLRAGGVFRQDGRPMATYSHLFWLKTKTGTYEVFEHAIPPLYRLYESTKIRMEAQAQGSLPADPPGWPELPLEGDVIPFRPKAGGES